MAKIRPDGHVEMDDGRVIGLDYAVTVRDVIELARSFGGSFPFWGRRGAPSQVGPSVLSEGSLVNPANPSFLDFRGGGVSVASAGRGVRVTIPEAGSLSWKDPVATPDDLPLVGNVQGDARLAISTQELYFWNGFRWQFNSRSNLAQGVELAEDWINQTAAGVLGWTTVVSGTGAAVTDDATFIDPSHWGIVRLSTGTSGNGRAALSLGVTPIAFGNALFLIEGLFRIPLLATAAQDYIIRVGLGDVAGAGDFANGIYFEYDRSVSLNWRPAAAAGGSRTKIDSGIAVAQDVWIKLQILQSLVIGTVDYFVDTNGAGFVNAGQISTNVPSGGQVAGPIIKIEKTAGSTSRNFHTDYVRGGGLFLTDR